MNKVTVYTLLVLVVGGVITYMVYEAMHPIKFVPKGNDFNADDNLLYSLIRADMQKYALQYQNGDTVTYLDDEAFARYDRSLIAGHKSKAAAYVLALKDRDANHPKNNYYAALLMNLQKKYENK